MSTIRSADPATHAELSEALSTLQLGMSASELHGALAGYLCAGGISPAREWLSALALEEIDDALGDAPARELFDRLFSGCAADLEDPELAFDLLLPDVPDTPALVAELRTLHAGLRIMLVSSLQMAQLEAAAEASGVDGVCNKGASAGELCERLYAVAAGSSTQNRLP